MADPARGLAEVVRLVDSMLVLDGHSDSLIRRRNDGQPLELVSPNPLYHVDLPRLRRGGVDCLFCMVGDRDLRASLELIDAAHRMCNNHDELALCTDESGVREAKAAGKLAIVLTIEGQRMFDERIEHLRNWHRLGVRMASITHGGGGRPGLQYTEAYFGYLSPTERDTLRRRSSGLTPFAREVLQELARLDVPVDVAHCNDATFWQVMEYATGPICYSHGACYELCQHSRALTDEMMRALAAKGGVMGIAFYRGFIHRDEPTLERLADHFLHALEVMGEEHVGLGSDYDGVPRWSDPIPPDPSQLEDLFQALSARGVKRAALEKVAAANFLRLLPTSV